jgi:hypothetical protein
MLGFGSLPLIHRHPALSFHSLIMCGSGDLTASDE